MMFRRVSLVVCLLAASPALAGDLNPPAGPVAPTMKNLQEVEPRIAINATNTPGDADSLFKITANGSYYLTGNVVGQVAKHGIEVGAQFVTIDLNGYVVQGIAGSLNGIQLVGHSALQVRNGAIASWGGSGLNGVGANGPLIVTDVVALVNGNVGINSGGSSVLSRCSSLQNSSHGIIAGTGSTLIGCTSQINGGHGVEAGGNVVIRDCVASGNTLDGFQISSRCSISGCIATLNGSGAGSGAGIHATASDCRIERNNVITCDRGIDVDGAGNLIIGNSCSNNTTNFDIAASNRYGVIIDLTAAGAAAVAGNVAVSTLGTTDPHANFAY